MFVVCCLAMLILTEATGVSQGGTIINVYASDDTCNAGVTEKNSNVAFSVGRKAEFAPSKDAIIPMDHVFYNDGGYFDLETSTFTAPVSGVYAFYFGACGKVGKQVYLKLYVGDKSKPVATAYNYNTASYNHASGSVYKKMAKGEQASMWLAGGKSIWAQDPPSTHFNGHLLKM